MVHNMTARVSLDATLLAGITGGGGAVYSAFNKVMPYVDSEWQSESCVERSSTIGAWGAGISTGLGLIGAISAATPAAPAAPVIVGAGGAIGGATAIAGRSYLKECNRENAQR